LIKYNLGASIESTKVAILVDATGSMGDLLTAAKNTIADMYSRISTILKDKKMDPKRFQIQFVAYRNYNAPAEELLRFSGWCDDPMTLNKFLLEVPPNYGWGNEAIEVALSYINQDKNVNEIIIIGDAAANTKSEIEKKRQSPSENYWKKTKFSVATYFEDEIAKLQSKKIKVNAFYLPNNPNSNPQADFQKMADLTGGVCQMLEINSPNGTEILTELVSKRVLSATGGETLVEAYDTIFHVKSSS